MKIEIYTPRRNESLFSLLKGVLTGFVDGRELAWQLFIRDLKASYSKSFLGILWLFLPPLATAGIWIFLSLKKVIAIQNVPMSYASFALCGAIIWSQFADAVIKPMIRYQAVLGMMGKLNFPREAIILATIYDLTFSFLIKVIILIPSLWAMGYPPTLYFIPALAAAFGLGVCGLAFGILLLPMGLLFSDFGKGLPILLPFAMYLCPVIYPLTPGKMEIINRFNPVVPFLEQARSLIGGYEFTMQTEFFVWSAISIAILLMGLVAIRIALPMVVERAGS